METENDGTVQYPLRVRPVVMNELRRLAKRQRRSLNRMLTEALTEYMRRQTRGSRRMDRWQFDGTEYNTETATALAHSGGDEPEDVLYKGSSRYDDQYWMVTTDEDGAREFVGLTTTNEAYLVYLGMPVHLVAEDEAFGFAEANAES